MYRRLCSLRFIRLPTNAIRVSMQTWACYKALRNITAILVMRKLHEFWLVQWKDMRICTFMLSMYPDHDHFFLFLVLSYWFFYLLESLHCVTLPCFNVQCFSMFSHSSVIFFGFNLCLLIMELAMSPVMDNDFIAAQ